MTAALSDKFSSDRVCRACGGTGVLSMGDYERPEQSVGAEYCDCQRPLLDADKQANAVKREQHKADIEFADRAVGSRGLEVLDDEVLEEMAWRNGWSLDDSECFSDPEMIGVRESRKYSEPEESAEWFEDEFNIGQRRVAEIRMETSVAGLLHSLKDVLAPEYCNVLFRQAQSRRVKADLAEYRRAANVLADLDRAEQAAHIMAAE